MFPQPGSRVGLIAFPVPAAGNLITQLMAQRKKQPKEPVILMDESDVVDRQKTLINDLLEAISKHRDECPDHDIRVLDQRLWSIVDMIGFPEDAPPP